MKIFNLLLLFRSDVAFGTYFNYLIGILLSGNRLQNSHFFEAFLMSGISFNFIYSYNQYSDWKIDKINKPDRVIPSGKVTPKTALIYSSILFIISIIYPVFISRTTEALIVFYSFTFLGFIYSFRRIYLKKNPIIASFLTSTGLFLSVYAGYANNTNITPNKEFLIALFFYLTSIIPFKDIEDYKGDISHKTGNFMSFITGKRLSIAVTTALLLLIIYSVIAFSDLFTKCFFISFPLVSIFFIAINQKSHDKIYKWLTRTMVFHIFVYFSYLYYIV